MLRTWSPTPSDAAAGALEPTADLAALQASRPVVIANAASLLAGGSHGAAHHQEGVDLAFDALSAAMTMDENQLLFDFADWLASYGEAHNESGPSAPRILAALSQAIDETYADARGRIVAAIEHLTPD